MNAEKTKWTPGPWLDSNGEWLVEPKKLLADLANARLISAAPALAEALQRSNELNGKLWMLVVKHSDPQNSIGAEVGGVSIQARAALAEAGVGR